MCAQCAVRFSPMAQACRRNLSPSLRATNGPRRALLTLDRGKYAAKRRRLTSSLVTLRHVRHGIDTAMNAGLIIRRSWARVPATYSHPASHTRQCDQINQRIELQEADRNRANQRRRLQRWMPRSRRSRSASADSRAAAARPRLPKLVCECQRGEPERPISQQLPRATIDLWRNPGDDLEIAASEHHARPMQTKALTCISDKVHRSSAFQSLIRDEEAAGSNPATPTRVLPVQSPILFLFGRGYLACGSPVSGSTGSRAGRIVAGSGPLSA